MRLAEIISKLESGVDALEYDVIKPYLRSILTYFENYYCEEIIAICVSQTNNSSYWLVSPTSEIDQALNTYGMEYEDMEETSESYGEYEVILANSKLLKDLIKK